MTSYRLVGLVAAVLLLPLSACGSLGHGEGVAHAEASPAVALTPVPVPHSTAHAPAPASASASPQKADPVVPQHRATLPPPDKERPEPARFVARSIDVDLPVVRTGVADDGRMQLPETNTEVAWYAFGSRPGEPTGTTVMAAHVDTRAEGLGPFARLRELHRGDTIAVTDSNGRTRRYTVRAVDDVRKSRIALDQLFRRDGPPELKVLTCGGPFSSQTGYRDNIVVTAQPA